MGLITKEVEINLCSQMIPYYENLGYEIPRYYNKNSGEYRVKVGSTIIVKVDDLPPYSGYRVDVECDCCGKMLNLQYAKYRNRLHNGKHYCHSCSLKVLVSGENHPNWKHDKTQEEREQQRSYPEYIEFVKRVQARDNYICQVCGKEVHKDGEVHHLNGYSWFVDGRTDETNAITLCESCHSNFHTQYGYKHSTKEEFEEWFGRTVELVKCGIEILPTKKVYCIETDTVYDSVNDATQKLNITFNVGIYRMCRKERKTKSVNGYHFLWHDDFINMTQKDIDEFMDYCNDNNNHKKTICLETGEIFDTCTSAADKYATSEISGTSNIARSCRNVGMTSYCREDGLSLHWMYYDEYLTKTPQEIYDIKHTFKETRPIICLSYNTVYKNATEASRNCGVKISNTSIRTACKREFGQAGVLPNKHKLTWMYYDLFVELPIEEQNDILKKYKELSDDNSFVA